MKAHNELENYIATTKIRFLKIQHHVVRCRGLYSYSKTISVSPSVCPMLISQPQLSLAIPPWVGAMSTGDVTTAASEENGEFCVAVTPATRTAGILSQLVKDADC